MAIIVSASAGSFEVSPTGSHFESASGTTDVKGGEIVISGSSPGVTLHTADLYVGGFARVTGAISASSNLHTFGAITTSDNIEATGSILAGTSFVIGSADLNETDMEKLDGITDGAGAANKALVLNASADIASGLRSVTGSGDAKFANFHATGKFYGDGSGLTDVSAGAPTSLSGTTAELTTGVETSGYLKVTGSSTLGAITATTYSGSSTFHSVGSISGSADIAVTGAVHAAQFYGGGAGLTGISAGVATSVSGTTAQLTTGVETSGYLKVSGSTDLNGAVTINDVGADVDFRVETADESHMLFIEGSSNRMSIGDNTGSPGATLEVKNNATAGATGAPLVQLNSHDTDQQCLDINADNITANVVNITANDVTTARVLAIGADGLTTGNALHVDDNSADTGTRNTALVIQNNAAAIAATALTVQSDGGITGVKLDKNFSDTTAATVTGLQIDFDKTGTSTSNNTMYGLNIDMDNTTATDGLNDMYGIICTPTLTHAADAGTALVYGVVATATGGTNGAGLATGARFAAAGADLNYGVVIDCEDGGVDLRIESSADGQDYFQIQTTTAGATTITTFDDGGTTADLTFNVDGDITLAPVGGDVFVEGAYSASAGFHTVGLATFGDGILASGSIVGDGVLTFGGFTAAGGAYSGSAGFHTVGAATFGSTVASSGSVTTNGSVQILEKANAESNVAAYGQLWVKTATPNELYFTTDADDDIQITTGTSLVAGVPTAISGTTAQLTTGVETSGYLKVSGSSTFAGDITATCDTVTIQSAESTDPVLILKNTNTDANGARLRFVKDAGEAGAPADVSGLIEFYADDANQDQVLFAQIEGAVEVATNGQEGGKLTLGVASNDGEMNVGLLLVDGDAEDEIDVIVGNTTTSLTSVAGVLKVGGNVIQASDGGTTITMDTNDNVTVAGGVTAAGVAGVTSTNYSGSGGLYAAGAATFSSTVSATGSIATDADLTVGGGDIQYGVGQNATLSIADGAGTNIAGRDLTLSAGNGTGTGIPSLVAIKVPKIGTSGGTVHTAVEILTVRAEGVNTHWNQATAMIDDEGMGDIVYFGTGTTSAGKMYYLHSGSSWQDASCTLAASGGIGLLGIAIGSNPASNGMLVRGFYDVHSNLSGTFTVGQPVYLTGAPPAAGGKVGVDRPSGSAEIVRIVGYCTTTANVIYFNPSSEYIELA